MTDNLRITSLARRLAVTQLACLLLGGAVTYQAISRHGGQIDLVNTHLTPSGIRVGSHELGRRGLTVRGDGEPTLNAVVTARQGAGLIGVGTEAVSLALSAKAGSPLVTLTATGRVSSELQIDTETGAWAVVRWVEPRTPEREVRTELLGSFSATLRRLTPQATGSN